MFWIAHKHNNWLICNPNWYATLTLTWLASWHKLKLINHGADQRFGPYSQWQQLCLNDYGNVSFTEIIYWKEKETHIHYECYFYQRCIVCLNESMVKMLNIHIWTNCDTFHCKQTTCVSRVNG